MSDGLASISTVDRLIHGWQGRVTSGQSPSTLALAYLDWLVDLANSPGKQVELWHKAVRKAGRLGQYAARRSLNPAAEPCIHPLHGEHRFDSPAWQAWPFALPWQAFLLAQQWWHFATTDVEGVSAHHEAEVAFAARQWLDVLSPSNYLWTNPEVLNATARFAGAADRRYGLGGMFDLRGDANLLVRSFERPAPKDTTAAGTPLTSRNVDQSKQLDEVFAGNHSVVRLSTDWERQTEAPSADVDISVFSRLQRLSLRVLTVSKDRYAGKTLEEYATS